jgi:hypothetical protein
MAARSTRRRGKTLKAALLAIFLLDLLLVAWWYQDHRQIAKLARQSEIEAQLSGRARAGENELAFVWLPMPPFASAEPARPMAPRASWDCPAQAAGFFAPPHDAAGTTGCPQLATLAGDPTMMLPPPY